MQLPVGAGQQWQKECVAIGDKIVVTSVANNCTDRFTIWATQEWEVVVVYKPIVNIDAIVSSDKRDPAFDWEDPIIGFRERQTVDLSAGCDPSYNSLWGSRSTKKCHAWRMTMGDVLPVVGQVGELECQCRHPQWKF